MTLINTETKSLFKEIGSQQRKDKSLVIARFSINQEGVFYYATEYDPETKTFFGYVRGGECDGYQNFSFNHLTDVEIQKVSTYPLPEPIPIQTLVPELNQLSQIRQLQSIRSLSLNPNLKERHL